MGNMRVLMISLSIVSSFVRRAAVMFDVNKTRKFARCQLSNVVFEKHNCQVRIEHCCEIRKTF